MCKYYGLVEDVNNVGTNATIQLGTSGRIHIDYGSLEFTSKAHDRTGASPLVGMLKHHQTAWSASLVHMSAAGSWAQEDEFWRWDPAGWTLNVGVL
jgi:hypothetical protein